VSVTLGDCVVLVHAEAVKESEPVEEPLAVDALRSDGDGVADAQADGDGETLGV